MVHVLVEDAEGEALERRVHGGDLREDVDAVAVVLDHPLDPAHLALDPVQALDQLFLVLRVAVCHQTSSRMLRKRRSRSEFVTTNRDEPAIAAAATIGLSSPATASGIAATLYANAQKRFPLIVRSVRPGEPDRVDRGAQVARHEREVGGLDRDVGAGADREPEVGLRERRARR